MADFSSGDLSSIYGSSAVANKNIKIQKKGDNLNLDMTDFIMLMITQLTNQGIDETVDTSDMLNQMIQMQMVETIATLTDASVMSYAASLVGQYVTVGKYDSEGNLQEIYGQVTGTGTMNGSQVIFVDNNEYYQMSEILAVGKLPPKKEEEDDDKVEDTEKPGETEKPDETPDETKKPEQTQKPDGNGSDYNGGDGSPDDQGA
ncbi:flagellar hook capping FlgD N-terminal domain-containing protein [uncultured Oscillibacter sp.]|jgi:flagellar basal-body rod modification protein FlgD|uniref:flagellar hook capping FlgD N-terminal domain-containing protein n=1 Tax=uncultured Oscillibacter sp. TaxID=876091 RepID=UPI0026214AA8|nr:flagellar hook capping FlgD N-terminal domain-containing protein [uncultured Oscillibacter sp.]